ncbi:MAG TPA: RidA family protein [Chloroflexota bacterium]|nr:RidA family protein [Chloroflexota bacterium]
MSAEKRLQKLGLELPEPARPLGSYVTIVRSGDLLFTAGHLPVTVDGKPWQGKVGAEYSIEDGAEAARLTGLNILATVRDAVGSLDQVARVVKLTGFVNSAAGFNQQPAVINGCSDLFGEVFGDAGRHARSAVGVSELPLDTPVEIEAIIEVR